MDKKSPSSYISNLLKAAKDKKLKPTLDALLALVESYKGDLDLDKILNTIGAYLLNLDISTIIMIFDETRQSLVVRHATLAQSACEGPADECNIVGKNLALNDLKKYQAVIQSKKALYVYNRSQSLVKKIPELKSTLDKNIKLNSAVVPLIIRGEPIGVLELF